MAERASTGLGGSRWRWQLLASAGVLAVLGGAIALQHESLFAAAERVHATPSPWLLGLLGATGLFVVARAGALSAATPGLRLRHAAVADQAGLGASNGIVVGGGAVGAGVKVAMLRGWGVSADAIAGSFVALAIFPALITWVLASAVFVPMVAMGEANHVETTAAVAGVVLSIASVAFWLTLLRTRRPARLLGRASASVARVLSRVVPSRFVRTRAGLQRFDGVAWCERMRTHSDGLVRRRSHRLAVACVAYSAATCLVLWSALQSSGTSSVSLGEVVAAFALVRVLIAFTPIPAGLGVADVGMVTLLVQAGGDRASVVGAVALYRIATWLLPIVMGAAAFAWWRRDQRRLTPPSPLDAPVAA